MMLSKSSSGTIPTSSTLGMYGTRPLVTAPFGGNVNGTAFPIGVTPSLDLHQSCHSDANSISVAPPRYTPEDLLSSPTGRKSFNDASFAATNMHCLPALKENDSMVYLEGPRVYSCAHCRTHLTNCDEIISKSFHGRSGRAFLFDNCVNVTAGTPKDRVLMTGLHSVCDISCKRCKTVIGWTYAKAYESSQKYKEGKFIVEKINLFLEDGGESGRPWGTTRGNRSRRSHGRREEARRSPHPHA